MIYRQKTLRPHKKLEKSFIDRCLLIVDATILEKGYKVTIDNYFSSTNLADKLKVEKITFFGTRRKQRKEVSKVEEMIKGKPLYLSEIYHFPFNATLTINKAEKQSWCLC